MRTMPLKRLIEGWIVAGASKARTLLMENANRGFWVVMFGGVAPWGGGRGADELRTASGLNRREEANIRNQYLVAAFKLKVA